MKDSISWEVGATVMKGFQDEKGKMHILAVASDDGIDLQRDQMTEQALHKMADQANRGVPLLETHRSSFEFGRSVQGTVSVGKDDSGRPVKQFVVDMILDGDWPQSRKLFKEVTGGQCVKQLSIGGKLNLRNRDAISVEMTGGGLVRKIHDLELDHISCTREKQAANPRTGFVSAIMKALDDENAFDGVAVDEGKKTGGEEVTTTVSEQKAMVDDATVGAGILAAIGKFFRKSYGGGKMPDRIKKEGIATPSVNAEESTSTGTENGGTGRVVDEAVKRVSALVGKEDGMVAAPVQAPAEEETTTPAAKMVAAAADEAASTDESSPAVETTEDAGAADVVDAMAPKCMGKADEQAVPPVADAKAESTSGEETPDEEEMLREIAILLSKVRKEEDAETEDSTPEEEAEKSAIRGALWNIRYLLAKQVVDGGIGKDAASSVASSVVEEGPYAPRTESAARPGVSDDKASGDAAVQGVTDHRVLAPAGGEMASTAPNADASMKMTLAAKGAADKLPQSADMSAFGKDLGEHFVEKSLKATSEMVLKSVEKIVEAQNAGFDSVSKTLARLDERMRIVETAGGVRQGGPRGAQDIVVAKSGRKNGVWGGLLMPATKNALSKM